jgi:hypothetical protein
MISLSFGDLLISGVVIFALAMLRQIWMSERARRSLEHEREVHLVSERLFGRDRLRERGD